MRMKRTLKVTVEMYSEVSEADLYDHIEDFVKNVKNTIEEQGTYSYNRTINTSWDDSHEVTIGINVEDVK